MYTWRHGWMDTWMGGYSENFIISLHGYMDTWMDTCIHGWMDGWMDTCMHRWMDT